MKFPLENEPRKRTVRSAANAKNKVPTNLTFGENFKAYFIRSFFFRRALQRLFVFLI